MANLKGGTFEKQAKDIFHRLKAFGVKRHNSTNDKTHSLALYKKRKEYVKSFIKFAEQENLKGKLNEHLTNDNIKSFLEQRINKLSSISKENYIRGFGSLIQGLKNSNIDIQVDKKLFNTMVKVIKDTSTTEIVKNRAVKNAEQKILKIYDINYCSGVIAQVQNELGIRVAEAIEIIKNLDKYLDNATLKIKNLIGKGNHKYNDKQISQSLINKINNIDKVISIRTYQNHLKQLNIKSHDFRYTYAKRLFEQKIAKAEDYNKIMKDVSSELNHSRAEMTRFYLLRA